MQSLDPVAVRTSADTTAVEQYARLSRRGVGRRLAADPDSTTSIVRYNGVERRVPLSGRGVRASVLPADTAQRVPKPPRALFESQSFPVVADRALIAARRSSGCLIWWWMRRRRKPPVPVVVDPFARAEAEFQRIEALGLLDAGERGRYVTLMIEVLRDYLAARYHRKRASR